MGVFHASADLWRVGAFEKIIAYRGVYKRAEGAQEHRSDLCGAGVSGHGLWGGSVRSVGAVMMSPITNKNAHRSLDNERWAGKIKPLVPERQ